MVRMSNILYSKKKAFLDSIKLLVKGGQGGNGFPKYGGIGGQGGCVYFESVENATLKDIWKKYPEKQIKAPNGEDSNKARILGRRGADVKISVPCGITIIDEKTQNTIELNDIGEKCLIAGGGCGGNSSNNFISQRGQEKRIKIDLKLIADVGLVGYPNAGKSSFLKAISRANPKIASYKFTTIQPQIGVVEYEDYRQITIADLPGLIEGAHRNIGMGHEFLRHVERCSVLVFVVDIFGFQLSVNHQWRNCLENVYALNKELELYDKTLLSKPAVLLLNKMDLVDSIEEVQKFKNAFENLADHVSQCPEEIRPTELMKFVKILPISARNKIGIDQTKEEIRQIIDKSQRKTEETYNDTNNDFIERKLREFGPNVV